MNDRPNKMELTVLPPIPAKRYFTIGEVSELCGVKPHVLRYWEQEFTQLKPVKRRGNRRSAAPATVWMGAGPTSTTSKPHHRRRPRSSRASHRRSCARNCMRFSPS
jgi:hypothetical protein